ncbi:tRNA lysidine(34) synthetase TilS [Nonlabens marinus]|uniref:tRNA(Ile)-lysidine synthase n=1 Tax=Nonlabens marinus S1-08 TaxID=1454201 RepID=W8W0R0_9FLAO|nr:tRNA lysidine(34) synthetase TilS [Nonlabens marinus]BAO56761.1 tRNA(Ile)-lysidine synthetase [Nonlabens marinus S1-08]
MQQAFQLHLQDQFPQLLKQDVLLAISGGLDSVVLAHLLKSSEISFQMAHVNFHLRGEESDADELFVRNLAQQLSVDLHVQHFKTKKVVEKLGISTQMAARKLRYEWFDQLLKANDLAAVLTAHHLDDQLETFLINLNRGTGLAGLTGIPEQSPGLLRPLLKFSRNDILEFAQQNQITWREDSSNQRNDYQRNKLRNQALPVLHDALPQLRGHFSQTLNYLQDIDLILKDAVARFRESVTTISTTGIDLHLDEVRKYPNFKAYLFYLLEEYGFNQTDEVVALMGAETGKYLSNATFILLKDRDLLRLEKITEPLTKKWYLLPETTSIDLQNSSLTLETIRMDDPVGFIKTQSAKNVLWLDKERLHYPLTLRAWHKGDRLEPFGMKGSQLVSDILTNKKLSRTEKKRVLMLCTPQDVLWVVGVRSSRHATVSDKTNEILKITWKK